MKIFLIDENKISKYILPLNTDDTFLITYKAENNKECLITLQRKSEEWYLKSNGNVNIIENNQEISEVKVEKYHKYTLKIIGKKDFIELYFAPSKEGLYKFSLENLQDFTMGASNTCHINYASSDMASVEAMFKKVGEEWAISTINDNNYKVYINNSRVTIRKLKVGDVIFASGLKIVWMNNFICVNNPRGILKMTGMKYINEDDNSSQKVNPVSEEEKNISLYNKDDYFTHYPSIRENVVEREFNIDAPPAGNQQSDTPKIVTLGSSIVMAASAFVTGYNVFYRLYNGSTILSVLSQIIMCISMLVGSILIPSISKKYTKKKQKEFEEKRQKKYTEYLQTKEHEIQLLIQNEVQVLNDNYPLVSDCIMSINKKDRNFWWRQYVDNDFLTIRVGSGKIPSNIYVNAPEEHFELETDPLMSLARNLGNKYKIIDGAPIVVSLKESSITSLIINNTNKDNYIYGIITQLIALHSSLDLKIALFTTKENASRWEFFKYLPHTFSDDFETRLYATNEADAKVVSNFLEEELKKRKEESPDEEAIHKSPVPYYLIITDDYRNMGNIQIIDDLVNRKINNYGFSLLDIEESVKKVPTTSTSFIEVSEQDGVVIEKSTGLNSQKIFQLDKTMEEVDMRAIANSLLNIPVTSAEGPSVLPSSLNFLDMFGVSKIEQLNILNRWQSNNPVVSLDTPVGVHASGDKFNLDLHEKAYGPHGLIAGSTGSGKSEFIITYILSMIINYHPYEVQFVLIDYKGGGLAGAFENRETGVKIPHLVGTITNLDNSEMNRSLVSIQSELQRRQRLFNEVRESLGEGTIDIYKYQKLYREGVIKTPLAHLFIICDEFAELKQQRPEFMQQLISTSRIGRSLGIHLILATQKPSGVVNDQIWANSKFKVCLKVQDRSDSMEMLKRPEAASLKEVGRFYLQVGYNDVFDIGQSGWSGAKYVPSDQIIQKRDESLSFINDVGYVTKSIKDATFDKQPEKDYGDQLTNIVKYIYNLGVKENLQTHELWLPKIPDIVYINDLKVKYGYKAIPYQIKPIIGEYDDPVNQIQNILTVDLTNNGNTLIYGIPGSGKEKLLTTLIRSIVTDHTPDEVNIYIADFGSESLKIFANFPHVGNVITIDESAKIVDLFNMADREIEKRKDMFTDYAGSYVDYITNSGQKLPLMVIVINMYDSFYENYSRLNESVQSLYRDGAKYGVVFIISAIATNVIKSRSVQYFNNKICLQLSNDTDYRSLVNAPRGITPSKVFGRGIAEVNDVGYEFQTASFASEKDATNSLRELSKTLNAAYTSRAPHIPTIPEKINVYDMIPKIDGKNIPVGYEINNKEIITYNFSTSSIIPIIATNIDEDKISFVHAVIRLLSLNKGNSVNVIDFANAFPKVMENVEVANKDEMYENAIIKMHNDIITNKEAEQYYFILGSSYLPDKISKELYASLSKVFSNIKNYPNSHIILVDVSNGIKKIKLEPWYEEGVNSKTGIWLGENVGTQLLIGIQGLSPEVKKLDFPYMGVIVTDGKYEVIQYMLDMEELL